MPVQTELGRDLQGKRWGPRPLDLDIIFYEGLQHREESLEIPHPRWQERPFVQVKPLRKLLLPHFDCSGVEGAQSLSWPLNKGAQHLWSSHPGESGCLHAQ